jgi:hypothetical protein
MIDLSITHAGGTSTPSLVLGQFPIYTSSIDNPANDIFYKIRAELNGNIPLAGVTGVANLFDSRHDSIIQSYPFETDGWGEASISIDHSMLLPDHFTVELRVDEEWREWLGDVSFAAFEIESSASGGQDDPNRDEMSLELTAHLRRNILVAGETIIIDWSVESGQELNVLEWTLFDSIGRVLAADTTGQFGNTEGVLSIEIPESLDVSMRANIYLTARGIYGASDSVSMTIWNIADDTELIVNVQPDMARPGDTITVDLELGSEIDYLYWEWSLYEGGNEIATGNGWKASTKAGFTIELEQRQLQTLSLQIRVLDGTGTLHQEVRTIELRDIVELSVESDFSTNAGDPLALSWRITSSSIADGDKATSINIQLIQMGTGDVAHEISVLATGYSGELDLNIPTATRPGTYLLIVDVETAGGTQLTSQSLIDVHEPREKNYLLGMEIPPWSSIFSTLATAFLILNLAAIWTVLIKRRREKSEDEEASDLFDKDDEFAEEISTYEGLESFRDDESNQGSLTPSFVQDGAVHKDGFEWLEDPVGSERWWYRSEYGQEWTRSE